MVWQIDPAVLPELMAVSDEAKAMFGMTKMIMKDLERA